MFLPGFILVVMIPFRACFTVNRIKYNGMVMVWNHVVRRYHCETQQQEERYVLFPDQFENICFANIIKKTSPELPSWYVRVPGRLTSDLDLKIYVIGATPFIYACRNQG
jgi:hypothetical protein